VTYTPDPEPDDDDNGPWCRARRRFQIQRQSYANERFPGVRQALGLHDRNGQ
jgi:hypothetical protein